MVDLSNEQKGAVGGVIGVVLLLAGFGGGMFLTQEQIDSAYVCTLTGELGVFDRLSGSGKTGYYTVDSSELKEACRQGSTYEPWISLSVYAEQQGVSIESILISYDETGSATLPTTPDYSETDLIVSDDYGVYRCVGGEPYGTYNNCYHVDTGVFRGWLGEIV